MACVTRSAAVVSVAISCGSLQPTLLRPMRWPTAASATRAASIRLSWHTGELTVGATSVLAVTTRPAVDAAFLAAAMMSWRFLGSGVLAGVGGSTARRP